MDENSFFVKKARIDEEKTLEYSKKSAGGNR